MTPKDSYSSGKQDDHAPPSRSRSPSVGKQPTSGLTPDDAQSSQTASGPSTAKKDPAAIAQEIRSHAPAVPRAGAIQSLVTTWTPHNRTGHNPQPTLTLMMACKALSSNATVAELIASKDFDQVKAVVEALQGLVGRQIIQAWGNVGDDIAMRGQAWDIFLQGVDALTGQQDKLNLYFGSVLGHDKGYGQTFGATQSFLELAGGGAQSFAEILGLALAEPVNTNIWMGGMDGSGKIRDQLARGLGDLSKRPKDKQVDEMWTRVLTALVNAHSPGDPQWRTFPAEIRTHEAEVLQAVSAIVPHGTDLDASGLDDALMMLGA